MDPQERLKIIRRDINRMPGMSITLTKVLQLCNNPLSSPNDVNRVISLDPVLTGKVLKLINSAYYSMPEPVTSLTRAMIIMGMNTVKNLALGTAVLEQFGKKTGTDRCGAFSVDTFWIHSRGVGVTTKLLSVDSGNSPQDAEECFIAGLLHDMGKIPLSRCFTEDYDRLISAATEGRTFVHPLEKENFSMDHAQVGKILSESWRLSPAIIASMALHHRPDEAEETIRPFVMKIHLADLFINRMMTTPANEPTIDTLMANALEQAGLSRTYLEGLHQRVTEEINKAKVFLDMAETS